jgi:hypothetical protein
MKKSTSDCVGGAAAGETEGGVIRAISLPSLNTSNDSPFATLERAALKSRSRLERAIPLTV